MGDRRRGWLGRMVLHSFFYIFFILLFLLKNVGHSNVCLEIFISCGGASYRAVHSAELYQTILYYFLILHFITFQWYYTSNYFITCVQNFFVGNELVKFCWSILFNPESNLQLYIHILDRTHKIVSEYEN